MVVIRLSRGGSKKRPFYNIVATDRRNRRDGRFLERVGYYNPMAAGQERTVQISLDRVEHWKSRGAQLSEAVTRLVKDFKKLPQVEPVAKPAAAPAAEAAPAA